MTTDQEREATPSIPGRRSRLRGCAIRAVAGVIALAAVGVWLSTMVWMPGKSFKGTPPELAEAESQVQQWLQDDLQMLASTIGERNLRYRPDQLAQAARFISDQVTAAGHVVQTQAYELEDQNCQNIEVEIAGSGSSDEIVIVGAHYDTVPDCAGANDNGSGVVSLMSLARIFSPNADEVIKQGFPAATTSPRRTLRLVFFVNEEPPYFMTSNMGSYHYAARCRDRKENIVAMISLETMGYFSNSPKTQQYPVPALGAIYPTIGNFISFVGNTSSRSLVRDCVRTFRKSATLPSEGAALPEFVGGVGWSDQWSFWQHGYPGIMVTDTAPFRYPHYHTPEDTVDKIDFENLTRVVAGLVSVVTELVK